MQQATQCLKFVVTTEGEYPQVLELQCTQDKADNLIQFNKVGDVVDCAINLRGREWTSPEGKVSVFNTIEAWKVFKADSSGVVEPAFEPAGDLNADNSNDLPF